MAQIKGINFGNAIKRVGLKFHIASKHAKAVIAHHFNIRGVIAIRVLRQACCTKQNNYVFYLLD
jgi:hypothetical protein